MEDDAPVIYGLEFQFWTKYLSVTNVPMQSTVGSKLKARALTPQTAETDAIRFLVGTQSLKYDNQAVNLDSFSSKEMIISGVLVPGTPVL
ncbi:protein TSSC1-like protein [Cricetulus griseus]|nr:protein TSSC1-like protein [Cricetulus griseus]